MIQKHDNPFNIPSTVRLYSKKEIFDELDVNMMTAEQEKYYSSITGSYYNAILHNGKLFAKQYPEKDFYYIV